MEKKLIKVGIMQPYFFPYIGYWQLMNAVDKYVIYDDVNYIRGGWVNRNRILMGGEAKYFNVQLIGASQNKLINEIIVDNNADVINRNLKTLSIFYAKAPYFSDVYPILETILTSGIDCLSEYLKFSFKKINDYLDIDTELILSSELKKDCSLKGQEKILAICKLLSADEYYNAIGGMELYSFDAFERENISLKFLQTNYIEYKQFNNDFIPYLSIIDVLMFNSKDEIKEMLDNYSLIDRSSIDSEKKKVLK